MRRFSFTAKNIGRERYLTYIMGEGMELDEDVLDFCEENEVPEILNIIYEEDDDYDYLTYDVTGRISITKFAEGVVDKGTVLKLLRTIAIGMISIKEDALPLSYVILNKDFMYIDPDTMNVKFLFLPVESEGSVAAEFKSFVRQLVASFIYNVEEDLSYVGQLLTYINGNGFNLRGLIGLTEALMQDSAIEFTSEAGIATDEGVEIVDTSAIADLEEEKKAMDFMNDLGSADDALPEIGDDDEEDVDVDVPEVEEVPEPVEEPEAEETPVAEEPAEEAPVAEEPVEDKPETIDDIKAKIQEIVGTEDKDIPDSNSVAMQKPVRVSKAAILKEAAEKIEEEEAEAAAEAEAEKKEETAEEEKKEAEAAKKQKTEVIDNTILGSSGTIKINPYLVRVDTGEKTMINKPVFKIGKARGVDYKIDGNGAISRQHAFILHKGDSYYIKDNKSTNHTYVDHVEVEGEQEVLLKNNCTITLGNEDFTFKLS